MPSDGVGDACLSPRRAPTHGACGTHHLDAHDIQNRRLRVYTSFGASRAGIPDRSGGDEKREHATHVGTRIIARRTIVARIVAGY